MRKTIMLSIMFALLLIACSSNAKTDVTITSTGMPGNTVTRTQTITNTLEPEPSFTPTITPEPTETPKPTSTSTPSIPEILANMGRIAFASDREGWFDIYTILANGDSLERLTTDTGNNKEPKWSPDGERIAFSSDRYGSWDIFVMNADGSGQELLIGTSANETNPVWSEDGEQLAYISEDRGKFAIIFIDSAGNIADDIELDVEGYEVCCLTWDTEGLFHFSVRLGDGLTLILWAMNRDEFEMVEPKNEACCLSWQPGYTGGYAVSIGVPGGWQIFQDAILDDPKPLVTGLGNNLNPTWSPWHNRGQWLAYTTDRDGNTDIYLVEVNTLEITPLVVHPAEDIQPDWQK